MDKQKVAKAVEEYLRLSERSHDRRACEVEYLSQLEHDPKWKREEIAKWREWVTLAKSVIGDG